MDSRPRLLIVGDSFSAVKNNKHSWPCQLDEFDVTNLSLAGCSEYRILQQIKSINVSDFDFIVVVHSSPNRIYVNENPLHQNSETHHNCDLIYQDVRAQPSGTFRNNVVWWFENVFDLEYAETIHNLLINFIIELSDKIPNLHITFFDNNHDSLYNLHSIWKKYPGDINHLSIQGNQQVTQFIRNKLKEVG